MTKREALQATVSEFNVNNILIDKILLDNSIDGDSVYTKENYPEIEICKAYSYKHIATNADFKQGSYAITYKQASNLLLIANKIFAENGLVDEIVGQTKIKLL